MTSAVLQQHASLATQTTLSPRLQHAVRLLQMSSMDFAQVVRETVYTNPFLEQDEQALDAANDDLADPCEWQDVPARAGQGSAEGTAFDTLRAPRSLSAHLLEQLNVLPISGRDLAMACAVVDSLDNDGYLRTPLGELGDCVDLDPAPEPDEWQIALRRVQSLDPAGVGARNLRECLQLQLGAVTCPHDADLVALMLRDHFDQLGARDLRPLLRRLGVGAAQLDGALAALRRLDPRPGWRFSPPPVAYITPDVIARKVRGRWQASLNEAVVPRVKLNRSYAELLGAHGERHSALATHLQEARWTLRNVEQRFSTILQVAQAILDRQHQFLAYGAMAMKPLALREIAQAVGVHESTVSRVTNNKYIATPAGVFELKFFFSRGMATARGDECSPTAVRGLVQELIAGEDKSRPLSDVELARELQRQGLQVARRTVTKYRQQLKIEPAERRKLLGCP